MLTDQEKISILTLDLDNPVDRVIHAMREEVFQRWIKSGKRGAMSCASWHGVPYGLTLEVDSQGKIRWFDSLGYFPLDAVASIQLARRELEHAMQKNA